MTRRTAGDAAPAVPTEMCIFASARYRFPKSPRGRVRRIASSRKKLTASRKPGAIKPETMFSATPSTMPAMIAPCMLPSPPSTTMTNAFIVSESPVTGVNEYTIAISEPAAPAIAAPRPNVTA